MLFDLGVLLHNCSLDGSLQETFFLIPIPEDKKHPGQDEGGILDRATVF
jgi:hypothetical protein